MIGLVLSIYFLIFICLNFLLKRTKNRSINFKKILIELFRFESNFKYPFTRIGLVLIFFRIFLMMTEQIFTNSIKTHQVIVDTKNTIKTLDQLLNSKLVICWFKDQMITEIMMESKSTDILKRLYEQRKFDEPMLIQKNKTSKYCMINLSKLTGQIDFTGKAILSNLVYVTAFLKNYIIKKPNANYWISGETAIDYLSVIYFRNGLLREQKDAINKL